VTSIADAASNVSNVTCDTIFRKTRFSDALQHTRRFAFDAGSRVTGATDAAGKTDTSAAQASRAP
jgi:YD repeat-containing protein